VNVEPGTVYRATFTDVRDENGTLITPSAITCTITLPDQTTATPTVVEDSTGNFHADYLTTTEGLHFATWAADIPNITKTDYFTASAFRSIVSISEAKAHLNMTGTGDDDELRRFMQAATELVESRAGTCVPRTVTDEWITGSVRQLIRLPSGPLPSKTSVTSITSTWPGGPSWGPDDLIVNPAAGTVRLKTMVPFWWGPWTWSGTAGRTVIPERFLQAAKEQLRHLWETQRGPSPSPPLPGEELFTTGAGWSFSVPQRVIELLAGDVITPVMA
jgi:hypothetical protein